MNILDLIIAVFLLISAMTGFKKGFLGYSGGRISNIAATAAALFFNNAMSAFLGNFFNLSSLVKAECNRIPVNNISPALSPSAVAGAGTRLAGIIVTAVSFIIVFVVSRIIFLMIWKKVAAWLNRGALTLPNQLGGLLIMVAKGIVIIVVLLVAVHPILQTLSLHKITQAAMILAYLQDSALAGLLFKISPHLIFIPGLAN